MDSLTEEHLHELFQPNSDVWDRIRLKELGYSDDGAPPDYPRQHQVQVFQKIGVRLQNTDYSIVLDSLRARDTLSQEVVNSILEGRENRERYLRLVEELHKRATIPSCDLLSSLFLSLLDSCESNYHSSQIDNNFDAAKHVKKETLKDVQRNVPKNDPIDVLYRRVENIDASFSREAITELTSQLGISELVGQDVELPTISQILRYLSDTTATITLPDIVRSFILAPGCGYLVSGLSPICESNPPDVTRFFHNLPGDSWLKIAHFMNCEQKVISAILKECSAVGNQVQMFLRWWRMPDCGKQCNLDVLKRLKKSCGIKDEQLGQLATSGNLPAERIGTLIQQANFTQNYYIYGSHTDAPSDVPGKKVTQKLPSNQLAGNSKEEALLKACLTNDWRTAESLLVNPDPEEEKYLNSRLLAEDEDGKTALYHACLKGKIELMKKMMSKGAKPTRCIDNDGVSVLQHSSVLTNVELLEILLGEICRIGGSVDEPNKDGTNSPLLVACKLGGSKGLTAVKMLLQHGAKPDGHSNLSSRPVIEACEGGHVEIFEFLIKKGANINLQDRDGNTALIKACLASKWHIVEQLLTFDDINIHRSDKRGTNPLFAAIMGGNLDIVEVLLQRRAKVNIIREINNPHVRDFILEETPLACACARGFQKIMEMLLLSGADLNHLCSGIYSPLSYAILSGQGKIVRDLLERKQLDTSTSGLRYPIIVAVTMKNYECAEVLLQRLGGPERALESALTLEFEDLQIAIADYNEQKHAPSSVWRDTGPLDFGVAEQCLYKFCDVCLKTLWNTDRDIQPPQIYEIVSSDGTYPLLSKFMYKVAKRSVQARTLSIEFFGIGRLPTAEPSPFRFLTQNGYLSYDDFMAQAVVEFEDDLQSFMYKLVQALHCIPGCEKLPYEADRVMHMLFSGALQFTTLKPVSDQLEMLNGLLEDENYPLSHFSNGYPVGELNSQQAAIARSDSSSFDPYKPMIGGQTFDERNKQRYQSSHSQQAPSVDPQRQTVKSREISKPKPKLNHSTDSCSAVTLSSEVPRKALPSLSASTPSKQRPANLVISGQKSSREVDLSPETPEDEVKRKNERYSSLAAAPQFGGLLRDDTGRSELSFEQEDVTHDVPRSRVETGSCGSAGAEVINMHQTIETPEQLSRMFQYAESTIQADLKAGKIKVCIIANHE